MTIDWENILCDYIKDNENYYECMVRLIKEYGTRKLVAKELGINWRQITNLFYGVKNESQSGERTKGTIDHTKNFVSDIHRWLTASDIEITREELQEFLHTDKGQELIRAKLTLLQDGGRI